MKRTKKLTSLEQKVAENNAMLRVRRLKLVRMIEMRVEALLQVKAEISDGPVDALIHSRSIVETVRGFDSDADILVALVELRAICALGGGP